jgi:hypothetical protein
MTELLLVGLGARGHRPLLLARTKDGELAVYHAFEYFYPALVNHLFKPEWLDKKDPIHFEDKDGNPISR